MRKLVSLGLLAICTILATQSVFAYNIEKCDEFKGGTPGLYGLCQAFVNAGNDNARAQIEKNYAKRAGPDDPVSLEDFFNEVGCPCWILDELAVATGPLSCGQDPDFSVAVYQLGRVNFAADGRAEQATCTFVNGTVIPPVIRRIDIDDDEFDACINSVNALIAADFDTAEPPIACN